MKVDICGYVLLALLPLSVKMQICKYTQDDFSHD